MKNLISIFIFLFIATLLISFYFNLNSDKKINNEKPKQETKKENEVSKEQQSKPKESTEKNESSEFKIFDKLTGQVLTIPKKDFICGVVATEMPIFFETEALKAQTIATNTYFTRLQKNEKERPNEYLKGADFEVDNKNFINYSKEEQLKEKWGDSFEKNYKKLKNSVDSVYGKILKKDDEPIVAVYHAISSGKTEKSSDVFGGDLPYLKSVPSPGDILAPNFQTTKEISAQEIEKKLTENFKDISFPSEKEKWFQILESSPSGTVKKIKIGSKECTGYKIREMFSLRSSNFEIKYSENKFNFTIKGYGHGVGMSQTGAQQMAKEGQNYEQILKWYYPGTNIF